MRGGLALFLVSWGGGLAGARAATLPREIEVGLRAGEERDVVVDLGQDARPDLDFVARLTLPAGEAWRKGLLSLSLADAGFPGATEQRLPHDSTGRRLRLRAAARLCSPAGEYQGTLSVVALRKPTDSPASASEQIPIVLSVEAGPSCAAARARAGGFALLVVLAGLYLRWMFFRSSFLSPELLAGNLQPLRWNANGLIEGAGRGNDLRGRITRQLTPWRRALAWLGANPLVFGLPWQRYEETVQIDLGRRPDVLSLTLLRKRKAFEYFRARPEEARKRLFATAIRGGGILFFGAPDAQGRIGSLIPERPLRPEQLATLGGVRLVEPEPEEKDDRRPAGWAILGSGGRS
ncbi:MAG TPA: hypothetical protein VLV54_08405 [Thermoanaerobaculia bacterium]|nr:hypothetical protein [Thermoanaerobaculia bacterium]